MKDRVIRILVALFSVILVVFTFIWLGKIQSIEVGGDFSREVTLQMEVVDCLSVFKGKSFWILPDKTVQKKVIGCNKLILDSSVSHSFPGKLEIKLVQLQPLIKVDLGEGQCLLVQDSAKTVEVPSEQCLRYGVPELFSKNHELNSFVYDYATNLIKTTTEKNLQVTKIEYKGDQVAPWYEVTLTPSVTVYLPASTAIAQKITMLSAALDGLNDAKERYSVIDLRFDRVVYK